MPAGFDLIDLRAIVVDAIHDLPTTGPQGFFAVAVAAVVPRLAADDQHEKRQGRENESDARRVRWRLHVDLLVTCLTLHERKSSRMKFGRLTERPPRPLSSGGSCIATESLHRAARWRFGG